MRRVTLPQLIFAGTFLFLFAFRAQIATAQCDTLSVVKQNTFGCADWRVKNRNSGQKTINRIWLEIVTPGMAWEGSVKTANWTVLQLAPNILELDGGATGVRTGQDLLLRLVCLERMCPVNRDYRVKWSTFDGSTLICTGFENISCTALDKTDSLSTTVDPVDWLCHRMTVHNRNSALLPLEGLQLKVLTPGVVMSATAPGGWKVAGSSTQFARLEANPDALPPGDSLPGIRACFTQVPAGIDSVDIVWETVFSNVILSYDTMRIRLGRQPRCDSLVVRQASGSADPSCKEIKLFNLHEPQSPVTSFVLQIVTSGAVFVTGASGPWQLAQETSKFLRYSSISGGIGNADSIGGFRFCILNASGSDMVTLRLTTADAGRNLCSVETDIMVPAVDGLCDRFTARRTGGSSYVLGFLNSRQPALPLDGFSFEILNSGPTLLTATAAGGWVKTTTTASSAVFSTGTPVFPGKAIDGFDVRFSGAALDSVVLRLCTTAGGADACCDTLVFPITSGESRCDSLLLTEAPVPGSCLWRMGFVNTHLPASQTTRYRVQALTLGARLTATDLPAGWMMLDDGSTGVLTLQRDTATGSDLSFDLSVQSPSASTLFEWCTEDTNGPICCGIDSVYCPVEQRCGTLEIRATASAFARDLRLRNELSPPSPVDAIRMTVTTPGSGFADVQLPSNWNVTINTARDTALVIPDLPIASDSVSSWFTVSFIEAPGCDSIRWNWCAMYNGVDLCCDTGPAIACPTAACDTVLFSTDPTRPCCFDLDLRNGGTGDIDGLTLTILTPGASAFSSTMQSPTRWTLGGDTLSVQWNTTSAPVLPGMSQDGYSVCFNNGWIENSDFRVAWETYTGRTIRCSDTVTIACDRTLAVEQLDAPLPIDVTLQQNYPNPFTGSTSIVFALPKEETVNLQIFDTHGRVVASLCSGRYEAGSYRLSFDAASLPAGSYLLRLTTGRKVLTRMMSLLR